MHHLDRFTIRAISRLMGLYIFLAVSHLSPYALQLNHSPIDIYSTGTDSIQARCEVFNLPLHTVDTAPLSAQCACKQYHSNHYH
jgi:hypothetical protein